MHGFKILNVQNQIYFNFMLSCEAQHTYIVYYMNTQNYTLKKIRTYTILYIVQHTLNANHYKQI